MALFMEAWLDSTAGILDFASIMAKLLVGEKQGVRNAYIGKGGKRPVSISCLIQTLSYGKGRVFVKIEVKSIDELLPAKYNPRKDLKQSDPEYQKLKKSILEFDYVDPVIWNEATGRVVGGHQRLKILKELGHTEITVSVVNMEEEREKALNIALNKTGGDWDQEGLKSLLEELGTTDLDIEVTGFDLDEVTALLNDGQPTEVEEDNFDADAAAAGITEPITKPGDLWQLGRHRLLCGDATMIDDVNKLMGGKMAQMVFTDPPYNVDYVGKTSDALKINNDKMDDSSFAAFLYDSYLSMFAATEPGGAIYVCHADSEGVNFRQELKRAGWLLKQCLIWVKNTMVMGRQDYHWKHEPILYGWKPGASHKWAADRKQTTVIEKPEAGPLIQETKDGYTITVNDGVHSTVIKVPRYEVILQTDDSKTTIWRFEKPSRNAEHPTMKPIGIPARAINNSSKPGDTVIDLFGGSGSTLMAAEQTFRNCYTMELDPKYCDVIIKRWEQFTGQKAELIKK